MSPLTRCYLSHRFEAAALLQIHSDKHRPLFHSESEGNSLHDGTASQIPLLTPSPVIVPIVWVRRVMADPELGRP